MQCILTNIYSNHRSLINNKQQIAKNHFLQRSHKDGYCVKVTPISNMGQIR